MDFKGYSFKTGTILHASCLIFFCLYCGFLQDHYVFIVSQFMYIPWNYAQKQAAIRASVLSGDSCTPSINIGAAEVFESEITEYIKEQV
jgi:hypothetical protein